MIGWPIFRRRHAHACAGDDGLFLRVADRVSEAMGSPANIIAWALIIALWTLPFAFGLADSDSDFLPKWFTSTTWNFPLNTVTTLVQLFVGFLIAAAANRVEKRNTALHQQMAQVIGHIETLVGAEKPELDEILQILRIKR